MFIASELDLILSLMLCQNITGRSSFILPLTASASFAIILKHQITESIKPCPTASYTTVCSYDYVFQLNNTIPLSQRCEIFLFDYQEV